MGNTRDILTVVCSVSVNSLLIIEPSEYLSLRFGFFMLIIFLIMIYAAFASWNSFISRIDLETANKLMKIITNLGIFLIFSVFLSEAIDRFMMLDISSVLVVLALFIGFVLIVFAHLIASHPKFSYMHISRYF